VNTLHHFAPSVPQILNTFDILALQQTSPWNALGMPTLEIFLAVIGVIGLLPADVAFSPRFTYGARHPVREGRAALGPDQWPHAPLMPAVTNAAALVPGTGGRPRFLAAAIALALGLGYFAAFSAYVWTAYHFGAVTMDPYGTNNAPHWSLDRALEYARTPLTT